MNADAPPPRPTRTSRPPLAAEIEPLLRRQELSGERLVNHIRAAFALLSLLVLLGGYPLNTAATNAVLAAQLCAWGGYCAAVYLFLRSARGRARAPWLKYLSVTVDSLVIGFTYVAKAELLRVPVFGWIIGKTGAVFVDRGDGQKARATLKRAAARVRDGQCVLVFAEGTRSMDGRVRRFKKGSFVLALEAQCDILPVAIAGSVHIVRKDSVLPRPGPVELHILEPIPTAGLSYADRDVLIHRVRSAIAADLGQTLDDRELEAAPGSLPAAPESA